jgi:hypothetical protein
MKALNRKFISIFMLASASSFVTLLLVQNIQGDVESIVRIAGKAFMVGFGLALLFAIPRSRKDYPWL